ncbi:MAG: hypothetical protein Ct9H300mP32_4750 [Verrucomicrobiota bacterium]|nr:MAG: hypothetical protein Ct9H300mP32_4750 [Verrucomicrobiota bacterium]
MLCAAKEAIDKPDLGGRNSGPPSVSECGGGRRVHFSRSSVSRFHRQSACRKTVNGLTNAP